PASQPDAIRNVVRAVRRHWLLAVGIPLVVILTTAAIVFYMEPVYGAHATIRIDEKKSNVGVLDALQTLSGAGSQIETEMEVLRSRTLALHIIDSLGLQLDVDRPRRTMRRELFSAVYVSPDAQLAEFAIRPRENGSVQVAPIDGPGEPRSFAEGQPLSFGGVTAVLAPEALDHDEIRVTVMDRQRALRGFQRTAVIGRPNREADIISIEYQGTDSVLIRNVVDALAASFIARRQREQSTDASGMVTFLQTQIDTLARQLGVAEEALRDYSETTGLVAVDAQAEEQVKQLATLQAQRDALEAERTALGALLRQEPGKQWGARQLLGFQSLLRSPATSEMLSALTAAEAARAELLDKRTMEDPEVITMTARISEIESQLRSVVGSYYQGLTNQVAALNTALGGYTAQLREIPEQQITVARLTRQASLLEEIYTLLERRLKEAEITASVHDSSVRVVDPAMTPAKPVRPNKKVSLAFAAFIGLLAGIGCTVAVEYADRTFQTREDLQEHTGGTPVLGLIPRIRPPTGTAGTRVAPQAGGRLVAVNDPRSPTAEAYRRLRTNISFVRTGEASRMFTITSPTAGDGKSTTSSNLAATLAQQGVRCLLVDGDLRRGALNDVFEVPREPGFSEVLLGRAALENAVHAVRLDGNVSLDFLPTGTLPPNPAELLSSRDAQDLLRRMRESYDIVIMDAPPLNLVTDGALLGASSDGVIMVVRAGVTHRDAVNYAMDLLGAVRAELIGTVLNDVHDSSHAYYGSEKGYYGQDSR
ncbi:MAG TPA: polysaccharide biosynthesis tyrosine autokinase, partial [Longimicrobiales bacterium]